ncbi:hypothetical protein [Oscillatoria acuminata]|uniref:Uncharacterized protein n=1 Tax=Oscillatoria acuminata PCC 6304 TaxID=56110 RepID=K9TRB9_9CYAN|nr:hypothetical protein [Oscillatoria acuminata]AFY84706.1 hypothetical protein Oscil6304_5210 [Oscillatoria acuminata PCC 6304]
MTITLQKKPAVNSPVECPQELRNAWARVFAHAWSQEDREFLRRLNKDPRQTIEQIASGESSDSEQLCQACQTILEYVNDPNSEEGFLALPPLPEHLQRGNLSEEQLYTYANQDGLYGVLRVC